MMASESSAMRGSKKEKSSSKTRTRTFRQLIYYLGNNKFEFLFVGILV